MKNKNKISIIIPTYNENEKYLRQCLESVINQDYNNIEIIIVDDGSNNNSKKICDIYANSDTRIKVIHKNNEGVSSARNIGICNSTGDFIMFLDSDDWLETDACSNLIKNMEKEVDILIFNAYINYNTKKKKNNFCPTTWNILTNEDISNLELQIIYKNIACYKPEENVVGTTWGKMYRRDFIIKNELLFNSELIRAEDHVFLLNAFDKNAKCEYYSDYLYNYRKSEKSTVNKFSYNIEDDFIKTLKEIEKFVEKKPQIYKQAYYGRIVMYIVATLKNDYFHKENKENKKDKFHRIDQMVKKDVFELGLKSVDKKILTKKQRTIIKLLKFKNILYYIFKFYNIVNKPKNFK